MTGPGNYTHGGARPGAGRKLGIGNKHSEVAKKPETRGRPPKGPTELQLRLMYCPEIPDQSCIHCHTQITYDVIEGRWIHMTLSGRKRGPICQVKQPLATPPPRVKP